MRCSICAKPIPPKRLIAVPTATRCVSCQSEHDERISPGDHVMAEGSERDDVTRVVESGWGINERIKSRTVRGKRSLDEASACEMEGANGR